MERANQQLKQSLITAEADNHELEAKLAVLDDVASQEQQKEMSVRVSVAKAKVPTATGALESLELQSLREQLAESHLRILELQDQADSVLTERVKQELCIHLNEARSILETEYNERVQAEAKVATGIIENLRTQLEVLRGEV